MVCVHPNAQPKVVLEKPGIEPATPGLHVQGIALIHYINFLSNDHKSLPSSYGSGELKPLSVCLSVCLSLFSPSLFLF